MTTNTPISKNSMNMEGWNEIAKEVWEGRAEDEVSRVLYDGRTVSEGGGSQE